MKDCIEYVLTGPCKVDIDKAVKRWTMLCRVLKSIDSWVLVEYTPKGKTKLQCTISEQDALELINRLGLVYVQSKTFRNCGSYLK